MQPVYAESDGSQLETHRLKRRFKCMYVLCSIITLAKGILRSQIIFNLLVQVHTQKQNTFNLMWVSCSILTLAKWPHHDEFKLKSTQKTYLGTVFYINLGKSRRQCSQIMLRSGHFKLKTHRLKNISRLKSTQKT